jgi:DNA-binding transcriptional ArsR family regulator
MNGHVSVDRRNGRGGRRRGHDGLRRDLATAVGLTESTVSHHLTQLRRAVLVESERRGMNVYHRPQRDALIALSTVLDPNCCQ